MPPANIWQILITGSLYEPAPTDPTGRRRVVYQRVKKGLGNIPRHATKDLQRRRHVIPADPKTPTQRAGRARIAAATAAWQALAEPAKQAWRDTALTLPLSGFQLFVRDFCANHPRDDYLILTTPPHASHRAGVILQPNPAAVAPLRTGSAIDNLSRYAETPNIAPPPPAVL